MSTTTTTDDLQTHGVLAFFFSVSLPLPKGAAITLRGSRIEHEQHAFFVYHLVANTHTHFPLLVYVCLLQSL